MHSDASRIVRAMNQPCRWPLLIAALIAYGSLYPFGFAMPASFGAFWNELLAQRRLWTGLGDVAGNVLLFVPLGVAGVLCRGGDRFTVVRGARLLAAGTAFAFAIQVLQVFEPTRDPALSDVLWNALGTAAGIAVALVGELHEASLPRHAWPRSRFAVALIIAWATAELWPFVPSLDWHAIKQLLRPLVLAPSFSVSSFVYHLISVLVLGLLLQSSASQRGATRRLVLLVFGVLAGKLVFYGAGLSLSFAAACIAGVAVWSAVRARLTTRATLVLLGAMVAVYTLRSLVPMELRPVPAPFRWIPFQALLEGSMGANVRSLASLTFAFGAMIWLVERAGGRVVGTAVTLAIWVGLIEVAQRWIVGRTPDITPSLLLIALALVFARLREVELLHDRSADGTSSLRDSTDVSDPRRA